MSRHPDGARCSALSAADAEPMVGTAPRADLWVVVEHPDGWGDASLARSAAGVRVVQARSSPADTAVTRAAGRVRVWVARVGGAPEPELRVGHVPDPAEVAGWDVGELAHGGWRRWGQPDPQPLLLVCANGRRDRCCGHAGGRLAHELWRGRAAGRVLTSTHLGGHRFAPTALLLPWGVLHGRLDAVAARGLLDAAQDGTTPVGTLRGHSALEAPAQVAEAHARGRSGYRGLAPLPVALDGDPGEGRLTATVRLPTGTILGVPLVREVQARVASCGKDPEPITRWTVDG
ncbi:MAG: hypothetical protein MUF35_05035 [Candidatus Nanopelagicales bacterium]|nr:hypothetical protein [Candidatus Nanopelagicales bacterium]